MNTNNHLINRDSTRVIDLLRKDIKEIVSEAFREEIESIKDLIIVTSISKNEFLSRKQTADQLHITLPTLRVWTKTGKIRSHQIGRRVLYKPEDINLALKEQPRFLRK
ncbi:MAG: helix-turn-helix domain-containing protein [Bacteroidales bacterium]|nr:helix-turn-helix domain-containing protein [Bacteroidales bacterium]